jgi:hypothetical protein
MEFIVRLVVAMSQSLPGKKKNSSMQQEEWVTRNSFYVLFHCSLLGYKHVILQGIFLYSFIPANQTAVWCTVRLAAALWRPESMWWHYGKHYTTNQTKQNDKIWVCYETAKKILFQSYSMYLGKLFQKLFLSHLNFKVITYIDWSSAFTLKQLRVKWLKAKLTHTERDLYYLKISNSVEKWTLNSFALHEFALLYHFTTLFLKARLNTYTKEWTMCQ